MRAAGRSAEEIAERLREEYGLDAHRAADVLHGAGFDAGEIAEILEMEGFSLSDIARGLRVGLRLTVPRVIEVPQRLGHGAVDVATALLEAGIEVSPLRLAQMLRAAGYAAHEVGQNEGAGAGPRAFALRRRLHPRRDHPGARGLFNTTVAEATAFVMSLLG